MSPSDTLPEHPAIATRRALQERAETRGRRFEPVAVPGDDRRMTVQRVWSAIWPGLLWLGSFLYVVALVVAYVNGWNAP